MEDELTRAANMKHTSDLALENELAPLKHDHEMAIMMGVESSEEQGRFRRGAFAVRSHIVQVTEGRCMYRCYP